MIALAEGLVGSLAEKGFKVSPKSLILANPPQLATQLAQELGARGIQLQVPYKGLDHDTDAHVTGRPTTIFQGRLTTA